MSWRASTGARFAALTGLTILLSGCATQQPQAHDDVDRLYLKYAEIAQRPSLMTSDEAEEIGNIMDRIKVGSDPCTDSKLRKLFPASVLILAQTSFMPLTPAELQDKKAGTKRDLKALQDPAALGDKCPGRGFPQIEIN